MSARDALPVLTAAQYDAELRIALLDAAEMLDERAAKLRRQASACVFDSESAACLIVSAQHRERQAALLRAEFERRVSEAACAWRTAA